MLSDIILSERQVALALIKDKMFRTTPRNNSSYLLYISPDRLATFVDCSSGTMLRKWLREQYENHPKGAPWYIDPETALDVVQHYGLA